MSKKKNKRKLFSEEEFIDSVCSKCLICPPGHPEMCYHEIYKHNPKFFFKVVKKELDDVRDFILQYGNTTLVDPTEELMEIFCRVGECKRCRYDNDICDDIVGCTMLVREQLKLRSSYKSHVNKSWKDSYKKDKYKHKTKTITVQKDPTPKFFCSPEFEGEVAEIVKNYSERKVMVI